jgi:hypothetical protein
VTEQSGAKASQEIEHAHLFTCLVPEVGVVPAGAVIGDVHAHGPQHLRHPGPDELVIIIADATA